MIWLALVGGLLLTALDAVHARTGTTAYAHPAFFLMAWWVPLELAAAASIGGWLYARGWSRLRGATKLASWPAIARGLFAMSALYAASGLLPATPESKLVVLATGALILSRGQGVAGAVLLAAGAVLGPLAEAALIRFGLFRYLHPDFLGVPMWLPALYGCVVPAVGALARRVLR